MKIKNLKIGDSLIVGAVSKQMLEAYLEAALWSSND